MSVEFRQLKSDDAAVYQTLRLAGLQEASSAFASSFEEECDRPTSWVESRLGSDQMGAVFGAFQAAKLVSIAGIRREEEAYLMVDGVFHAERQMVLTRTVWETA